MQSIGVEIPQDQVLGLRECDDEYIIEVMGSIVIKKNEFKF